VNNFGIEYCCCRSLRREYFWSKDAGSDPAMGVIDV
jgi:hypothetical protein